MSRLTICTWIWGKKYGPEYIERLEVGVRKHMRGEYRWLLAEPWMEDLHFTLRPGCFARLRMFDPIWQEMTGLRPGDRLACIDLDAIVTGELDSLFNRPESFVILQGANSANPCPYNGSLMMLRAGEHHDVWTDFSLEASNAIPFYAFPDDQGWLAHKLPGVAGWKAGPESGVYAFAKPGWPKGERLPKDARLVAFPGRRDPSHFTHLDWVKEHWQ